MSSPMEKASEGMVKAAAALSSIRHAADQYNNISGALATQGYDLLEKQSDCFLVQFERFNDTAERAVALAEGIATNKGWVDGR